jgi:hypothetical protein
MSDKHISKPVSSEICCIKQAKLISGSGLEDSASEAWLEVAAIAAYGRIWMGRQKLLLSCSLGSLQARDKIFVIFMVVNIGVPALRLL